MAQTMCHLNFVLSSQSLQLGPLTIEVALHVRAFETVAAEDISLQGHTLPGGNGLSGHHLDIAQGRKEHRSSRRTFRHDLPHHFLIPGKIRLNLRLEAAEQVGKIGVVLKGLRHRLQEVALQDATRPERRRGCWQVQSEAELQVQDTEAIEHLRIRRDQRQSCCPKQVLHIVVRIRGARGQLDRLADRLSLLLEERELPGDYSLREGRRGATCLQSLLHAPEARSLGRCNPP